MDIGFEAGEGHGFILVENCLDYGVRRSRLRFSLLALVAVTGGRADKSVRATRVVVLGQGMGAAGDKQVPLRLRRFGMTSLHLRGKSKEYLDWDWGFGFGVVGVNVFVEDGDEFGDDSVSAESGEEAAVNVHRGLRLFEGAGEGDA